MFLFQTGAIKSISSNLPNAALRACFYSKLVRLKVDGIEDAATADQSFYSKLVRLKVKLTECKQPHTVQFLFQTGAIKSTSICIIIEVACLGFLFQTGAIKRIKRVNLISERENVSIPNWCD